MQLIIEQKIMYKNITGSLILLLMLFVISVCINRLLKVSKTWPSCSTVCRSVHYLQITASYFFPFPQPSSILSPIQHVNKLPLFPVWTDACYVSVICSWDEGFHMPAHSSSSKQWTHTSLCCLKLKVASYRNEDPSDFFAAKRHKRLLFPYLHTPLWYKM